MSHKLLCKLGIMWYCGCRAAAARSIFTSILLEQHSSRHTESARPELEKLNSFQLQWEVYHLNPETAHRATHICPKHIISSTLTVKLAYQFSSDSRWRKALSMLSSSTLFYKHFTAFVSFLYVANAIGMARSATNDGVALFTSLGRVVNAKGLRRLEHFML